MVVTRLQTKKSLEPQQQLARAKDEYLRGIRHYLHVCKTSPTKYENLVNITKLFLYIIDNLEGMRHHSNFQRFWNTIPNKIAEFRLDIATGKVGNIPQEDVGKLVNTMDRLETLCQQYHLFTAE